MKKNNLKIAIISPIANESNKISKNLSNLLDIPFISCKSDYVYYQEIDNIKVKTKYASNEIYTIILSQFHKRIKTEKISNFISDGSVLDDIVFKKQQIEQNKMLKRTLIYRVLKSKYHEFEKKVEKLIIDYAKTAYDKIYVLENNTILKNKTNVYFEKHMLEILNTKMINYKIINGNSETYLNDILNDLDNTFFHVKN